MARSMNVAGRKMVGSISTSLQPGLERLERLLDAAGHFERVALGLLLDDEQQARAVVDDGVADGGRRADRHVRHVAQPHRGAAAEIDDRARQVLRLDDRRQVPDGQALVRRVDEAAGLEHGGVAGGLDDRVERDAVGAAAGRDRPAPETACRAGPRWRRWPRRAPTSAWAGSSTGPASVRSRCDSVFDQTPIFITRLVDDSGCRMTGGLATAGSCRASAVIRSCTSCRTCSWSVPCSSTSTTCDRPEHRLRAHRLDARHAGQRVLQRHGDEAFDLLAGQAGRFGLDLDDRRRELGEDVQRRRPSER